MTASDHTIVSIFLRGAMDGLSYLAPHDDPDYQRARPDLAIPGAAVLSLTDTFGLHPAAAPLADLWEAGHLALVPASGSTDPSRSHFDAMAIMEAGLGSTGQRVSGWLGRYVDATSTGADLEAVAIGRFVPRSLAGHARSIGLADLATFQLGPLGPGTVPPDLAAAVRDIHPDPPADPIAEQGRAAFAVLDRLSEAGLTGAPVPAEFGAGTVGADLWQATQLIRAEVGVRAITVDWGGWDHHDDLGTYEGGRMVDQLDALATAVRAFWDAVTDHHDHLTVVIMSEFGRRVAQNTNGGTDHGHGGVLTVLGGGLIGGVRGPWTGLTPDVLDRGDVPVLTDYRHVLAEIVDRRIGLGDVLPDVFPDFATGPSEYVGLAV